MQKCPEYLKNIKFSYTTMLIYYVARPFKKTLEAFCWDLLPLFLYLLNVAASNCNLFCSLQNALSEECFSSYEDIQKWLDGWIVSKQQTSFLECVCSLTDGSVL
ncbi:hypothetical protein AVEN_21907-1 [Araneus ventricosus]|uniref:Uncharacterized protein n=1 Tax=Araneus ventricosus TaxID=182803 RepID=A0A4Y2D2P3_ARAVE|nr:hypothetical protein AVEN_21907-1 [Araneus ventricosus]